MSAPVVCSSPARARHKIKAGDRKITIPALTVEWGARDIRDDWAGAYTFCSFACLRDWAAEKADQHDGDLLVEGKPPEGDKPAAAKGRRR